MWGDGFIFPDGVVIKPAVPVCLNPAAFGRNLNIQLIATLHDVNLMNFDILRQDEIWFIRRDEQSGASDMYSLNRFQIRYDKKIIKDYLLGRFGAIPCFGQAMEADDMGETIDE